MCSRVSFLSTFIRSFMKSGFSLFLWSIRSSFFNFQVLQLEMHSSGVSGVHLRHFSSKILSITTKSLFFSKLLAVAGMFNALSLGLEKGSCVIFGAHTATAFLIVAISQPTLFLTPLTLPTTNDAIKRVFQTHLICDFAAFRQRL